MSLANIESVSDNVDSEDIILNHKEKKWYDFCLFVRAVILLFTILGIVLSVKLTGRRAIHHSRQLRLTAQYLSQMKMPFLCAIGMIQPPYIGGMCNDFYVYV